MSAPRKSGPAGPTLTDVYENWRVKTIPPDAPKPCVDTMRWAFWCGMWAMHLETLRLSRLPEDQGRAGLDAIRHELKQWVDEEFLRGA